MIENFEWNDLVLTCKGWYESHGSMCEDFAVAIENNPNRSIVIYNKLDEKRVASILMNSVLPSFWELLSDEDRERRCFLYRTDCFYQEVSLYIDLYDCTFERAVMFAVHNMFCNHVTRDLVKLEKPVYGKGRRRMGSAFGNRWPKSMTYKHMNDIASKMFDK